MMEKIQRIRCSEVELEYLLTGQENGETLMLMHGAGANLRQFIPQHQYFSKNYRVLSVSLRGHGESSNPRICHASQYTLEKHRDDLLEVLHHLKIDSLHYVGNSAGGMIGFELIQAMPSLFKSLVTFGTAPELRFSKLTTYLIAKTDQMMLKINPTEYCRFISKYSSQYEAVRQELFAQFSMAIEAIPYIRRNLGNYTYLKTLENIQIPYLLIQGETDHDINKNLSSALNIIEKNENTSVIKLDKAGHIANLDQPESFNKIIETFINQ
ncbi:alpha/beta fold hydrolase [Vallitalea okinawensis]|uniref:alpha/beta fold hydrolase n=1 Tax=Vallitalea okinawensis TaxID=2078660 RepID=UPI0013006E62|nr:alpha/beta hydrolase [Vallitalea okinawensis]